MGQNMSYLAQFQSHILTKKIQQPTLAYVKSNIKYNSTIKHLIHKYNRFYGSSFCVQLIVVFHFHFVTQFMHTFKAETTGAQKACVSNNCAFCVFFLSSLFASVSNIQDLCTYNDTLCGSSTNRNVYMTSGAMSHSNKRTLESELWASRFKFSN